MKQKVIWGLEYDWRNDKCYNEPQHEECQAPIVMSDGKYVCIGCGEEVTDLAEDMKKWINDRSGSKTETEVCGACKQETMKIHYHKNSRTAEWEVGYGECTNCGMRFIV